MYASDVPYGTYMGIVLITPLNAPLLNVGGISPNTIIHAKLLQFQNAYSFIEVTEDGISIEVKFVQYPKALFPMENTELGIVVFLQLIIKVLVFVSTTALHVFLESYVSFSHSTMICSKEGQLINGFVPIKDTELGITIEVRPIQLSNAKLLMVVKELLKLKEVRAKQFKNADSPIEVNELLKTIEEST